jgi:hypothetical protein
MNVVCSKDSLIMLRVESITQKVDKFVVEIADRTQIQSISLLSIEEKFVFVCIFRFDDQHDIDFIHLSHDVARRR